MTLSEAIRHNLRSNKLLRHLIVGGVGLAVCGFTAWGYLAYTRRYNERAQASLAYSMELYERATKEGADQLWSDADQGLEQGYNEFSRSPLAPYFLVYRSAIAYSQKRFVDARELLGQGVAGMDKKSLLYNVYALKLALMKIDADDAETTQQGHAELDAFAGDPKNNDRDMALYYKGLLAFDSGDRSEAQKSWDVLSKLYGAESVWSQAAHAKLEYLA